MIYLFLDIDGVLCTEFEFWVNTQEFMLENKWAKELKVPYPFNSKCVKNYNKILSTRNDIKIILSSDWRKHWSLEQLDVIFKNNNVIKSPEDTVKLSSGYFGNMLEKDRMALIESYLIDNGLIDKNWIIIDDLNIRGFLPEEYKDRFFLTNDNYGLGDNTIVEEIINKLNSYETEKND